MGYMSHSGCYGCGSQGGMSNYNNPSSNYGRQYNPGLESKLYVKSHYKPKVQTMSEGVKYNAPMPKHFRVAHSVDNLVSLFYNSKPNYGPSIDTYHTTQQPNGQEYFCPNVFLNPNRPTSVFISSIEDIMPYVKDTFEKTTGKMRE